MSTMDDLYQRTLAAVPDGACRMLVATAALASRVSSRSRICSTRTESW